MTNVDIRRIQMKVSCAEKYPAKQHAQAVARKLGDHQGLIYLLGQYGFNSEDSDQPKTWKQRRYFYYCSGVDVVNCCLTYDVKKDHLVLYIPSINPGRVLWEGRGPTIEEAEESYDVDSVRLNSQLFDDLEHWKSYNAASTFYILHDDHKPDVKFPKINSTKLLHAIDLCRVIKDPHEIQCIRRANEISTTAHVAVLQNIHRFKNEAQIQGIFADICISNHAGLAYATIAGSGENAGTLHYIKNNEPLKGRQLVCLDAGSQYQNYSSDVTRSFPISGEWSTEASSIYDIVQEMQESCIAKLKPGVKMIELHALAHQIAIKGLLKLGLLHNGTAGEIYLSGTSRAFFPHGLGHHLGLEVHDVIGIPILRYDSEDSSKLIVESEQPLLEDGMVITIEPGIYFCRYELERAYLDSPVHSKYINKRVLEKYWPVGGVRIEDDILITAKGYKNLTTTPKGREALDIIQHGSRFAAGESM